MRSILMTLLLGACSAGGAVDAPLQGSTMIAAKNGSALYVVDRDASALLRVDIGDQSTLSTALDGEPARLARLGKRLFVTLADRGSVVELQDNGGTLEVVREVDVGTEPFGIVAHRDGIFVAAQLDNAVVQLNPDDLSVEHRFEVSGGPRWLAITPSGKHVFVGCKRGALKEIDTQARTVRSMAYPEIENNGGTNRGPLTPRVTGDIAVSEDGHTLAVPTLWVDNDNPVGSIDNPTMIGELPVFNPGYYSSTTAFETVTRFNNAVLTFDVGSQGADDASSIASMVIGFANARPGALGMADVEPNAGNAKRSYVSSVAISSDGTWITATMEASRAAMVFHAPDKHENYRMDDGLSRFRWMYSTSATTGQGPNATVQLGDETYVWSFIDREISRFRHAPLRSTVFEQSAGWHRGFVTEPWVEAGDSPLPEVVVAGRRLFYGADDPRIATPGSGVACATCHVDGTDDGLSWTFPHGKRQTPSLAGPVSQTTPVTWTDEVPTVADEAMVTSQGRMLGSSLTHANAEAIGAFVDWTRLPSTPTPDSDAVARGSEIFHSAEASCSQCHAGTALTDNQMHEMYDLDKVGTPTLRGVAASAPYLHDGSAPDLRALVDGATAGGMGRTDHLSDAQKDDLVAYLRTL